MAYGGWSDAAEAATTAVSTLSTLWDARVFATIDPEEYYDFTQVRPRVFLTHDMKRGLEWPTSTFKFHRRPKAENDVVLFQSIEPQLRWREYANGIMDFAERFGASSIIGLGALLADVPHTRAVQMTGYATDPQLQARLQQAAVGLSQYQGPTGILGVLHDAAQQRKIPSMSLWAAAPHYISAATNPTVALALLDTLALTLDWSLDLSEFRQESKQFTAEVNQIIQANPEASAYVSRLEQTAEAGKPTNAPLPPDDILLHDLEEFLRHRRDSEGGRDDG
jgi:predicted ATP-grasp superfamily ATP-dependent carboligase